MKRWLMLLVVAVVVGALAYGIACRCLCKRTVPPTLDRLADLSFLTRELGLSPAQMGAIRDLNTALGGQLSDCCARHCDARARLARTVLAPTNDPAQAEALLAEVSRAYADSERATLDHIRRVRTVLADEQRHRFDALIDTHLCRTCNMSSMPSTERTP